MQNEWPKEIAVSVPVEKGDHEGIPDGSQATPCRRRRGSRQPTGQERAATPLRCSQ